MKQTGSNKKNSRLYSVLWGCFCALWVGVILFFSMLSAGCLGPMPSFEELENPQSMQASEVISCDGQVLGYIGLQTIDLTKTREEIERSLSRSSGLPLSEVHRLCERDFHMDAEEAIEYGFADAIME